MSRLFRLAHSIHTRWNRLSLFVTFATTALLVASAAIAHAQFAAPSPGTQVHDASALKPPAGARVAIVEFADMECPRCGVENPVVKAAAAKYRIPWIRHDFLIPGHIWSPEAAVNARWFDTTSKALGDEYRDQVFASQSSIYNPDVLRQFTEKFAQSHGIALPFAIDPQGKLAADVKADKDLGLRTGIFQTPTIFIVTANSKGAPFIEVQHPDQDLYRIIDQALADTGSTVKTAPATPTKPADAAASKPAETVAPTSAETTPAKPVEAQSIAQPAASQQQAEPAASKDDNPPKNTWLFGGSVGVIVVIVVVAMKRRQRR
jgi:protein-disulfide isomerase